MTLQQQLRPATELARLNGVRFPNESEEYRQARDALLAEEIELRRHIERVAEQRRALPPGGEVTKDYRFDGEEGRRPSPSCSATSRHWSSTATCTGRSVERPCPMCTSLLCAWDGEARGHRAARRAGRHRALADRAAGRVQERSAAGAISGSIRTPPATTPATTSSADDGDVPGFNVFTRRDGTIRHFWSGEMGGDRRSRPGSARRARPDAALDHPRQHARRPRQRTGTRSSTTAGNSGAASTAGITTVAPLCNAFPASASTGSEARRRSLACASLATYRH